MNSGAPKDSTPRPRLVQETDSEDPELASLVVRMLELLGEDPARDGLLKTPSRVDRSLRWLTRGYQQSVSEVVGGAVFEEKHESMVVVRDIELYSLCEHHLLPFYGKAHIFPERSGRCPPPGEYVPARFSIRSNTRTRAITPVIRSRPETRFS